MNLFFNLCIRFSCAFALIVSCVAVAAQNFTSPDFVLPDARFTEPIRRADNIPPGLSEPPSTTAQISGTWTSLGPAPTVGAQVNIPPSNPVSGAIQAIAAHPTSADILYIGAVNGGVWRTLNATAATPTWVPLTDTQASLSIGALEFDPTDATAQTLVAGSARLSSFGAVGGTRIGVLRTTDGGNSWTALGTSTFANENLLSVAARGNIILSASDSQWGGGNGSGLFRSSNTGASFQLVSGAGTGLPAGPISDLVGDPGNPNRFYAAVRTVGVFRSDDAGANWVNVTANLTGISPTTVKIEMAVHDSVNGNAVYAGVINSANTLTGVWRSSNQGASWTAMDVPAAHNGPQGQLHFSICADRTNANIVYIGGDRISSSPFTGNLFRGNASLVAGSQFVSIVDGNAGNTTPHADSRELVTDANGNLIEGDDGGLYRRASPQSSAGTWGSVIGNLGVIEAHDVAYDSVAKVAMVGTQDNGVHLQSASGSSSWQFISGGDGGDVAIDDQSMPGQSIRYGSSQNLGGFYRKTYNAANGLLSTAFPALTVLGGGPAISFQFTTPVALNKVSPDRLIIGGANSAYESLNRGDSVTALATGFGVNGTFTGKPISYGGRLAGVANPDVLYYGSGTSVRVRTTSGGAVTATASAFPGGTVQDIVLDTNDWRRLYVIDSSSVYTSGNTGANWANITGNLTGVGTLRTLEFFGLLGTDCVAVGTDTGVYCSFVNDLGNWAKLGSGLPNAPVFDLTYSAVDNLLVAGTMGRGAFSVVLGGPNLAAVGTAISGGNGNGAVDPNECNQLNLAVRNLGGTTASNITSTLTTTTPGVTITQTSSTYSNLAAGAFGTNTTPFRLSTSPSFVCGTPVNLILTLNYVGGANTNSFNLASGSTDYVIVPSSGASIVAGTTDVGNHGDDVTTTISLPFSYTFYGQNFSSATLSANGDVQFNTSDLEFDNVCLPYSGFSYAIIPFWDDLRTDCSGGGIFTSISGVAPNRIFNIEWRAAYYSSSCSGASVSFGVRLYEGQSRFDFIYGTLNGTGGGAAVGAQKDTGSAFTQFECNSGGLSNGLQLVFQPTCTDGGGPCAEAPVASFIGGPTNGAAPLTVSFTNLSNGATNYTWDFGDGKTSTATDAANTYTNAGSYTVRLTAIGPSGTNSITNINYIVVTNATPVANFVGGPTNGMSPLTVTFTNLSTGATNYSWDFGDGHVSTATNAANTYSNAGSYTVSLQAVGPGGTNTLVRNNYIVLSNAPPILAAIADKIVLEETLLTFTASASDPDVNQTLVLSLDAPVPDGASINPASGVFTWTPSLAFGSTTNSITVRVTDDGSPAAFDAQAFNVTVVAKPRLLSIAESPDGFFTLVWQVYPGRTYRSEFKTNLTDTIWTALATNTAATSSAVVTNDAGASFHKFYRVLDVTGP